MRVGQGFLQRQDQRAADVLAAECLHPVRGILCRDELRHGLAGCLGVARVIPQRLGQSDDRGEIGPELVLERRGGQMAAVGRAIDLVSGTAACNCFAADFWPAGQRIGIAKRPVQEGEQVLAHCDIQPSTLAGTVAFTQRQQDVDHGRIGAAGDVGGKDGGQDRRSIGARRQAQDTGFRHEVQIMGGFPRLGSVRAPAADGTVDDVALDGAQVIIAKPEARHHAGAELLNDDSGTLEEGHQPFLGRRVLQVDRDAFLAAVEHGEIHPLLAAGGQIAAHVVARAGAFDLDDLRPRIGQKQRGHRSRQQGREIEDQQVFQRGHS